MSEQHTTELEEKKEGHERRWSALDPDACHPMDKHGKPTQGASRK